MEPTDLPLSTETPFSIPTKSTNEDASSNPPLPPTMDSVRPHSTDELVQLLKKTPLFMTDLDEAGGIDGEEGEEENVQIQALRALQYEGTRAEIAQGFKERGNEMVAEKRWKDAREFYTKGILALRAPKDPKEAALSTEDEEAEQQKEKEVEEACYTNRSFCNLELQNYRSTLHDTTQTLSLTPTNQKALYRSSLALLHLSQHTLSLQFCTRGLAVTSPTLESTNPSKRPSPQHTAFLSLRSRILQSKRSHEEREGKRAALAERKKQEQLCLSAALNARKIRVRKSSKGGEPELEDAVIHLEDPLKVTSRLFFPVLVLYPVEGESDFLKKVGEGDGWGDVLQLVLGEEGGREGRGGGGEVGSAGEGQTNAGPPWDTNREYTISNVESFMETKEGGMVKVGKKVRLLDMLSNGKVEVLDGIVRVFVVPKGKVKEWVEDMKARREKG